MEVKKILGLVLTLLGIAGMIVGLLRIFGGETLSGNSWVFAILGFTFFSAGIGLMKSIGEAK
ncbi:MAG: hypothetical protein AB8G22_03855 [Saprospiraceae bacterium]